MSDKPIKRGYNQWNTDQIDKAHKLKEGGASYYDIAMKLGRTVDSVASMFWRVDRNNSVARSHVPKSTMPLWDKPLQSQGDALILSDIEAPFHHADFINRCLDLADTWGIQTLHLAGDLLQNDSLSMWGSEWTMDRTDLLEEVLKAIEPLVKTKERARLFEKMGELGAGSGDFSDEMKSSRAVFRSIGSFKEINVALGNHDDRYLRALDSAMNPRELLHQIDRHTDERWKIAPYYYTVLETSRGTFRITHPRGTGRNTAIDLAIQFHQHVVMGHSHRWGINRDPSGSFWAIQTGHCVDENRLAYVMQRDARRDAHVLGATIIRDGFPFVLCPETPWDLMRRM